MLPRHCICTSCDASVRRREARAVSWRGPAPSGIAPKIIESLKTVGPRILEFDRPTALVANCEALMRAEGTRFPGHIRRLGSSATAAFQKARMNPRASRVVQT